MNNVLSYGKRAAKQALKVCTGSTILYKTNWYKSKFVSADHEIYPDNIWYRSHEDRNYAIVNLGSSGGKWAFDYTGTGVKGMVWAQQPQTLSADYQLLRHYHSILRKGGYVAITIMPFTGLNKQTDVWDAMRYLKLETQGEPIETHLLDEALRYSETPIMMGRSAVKSLIKYVLGKDKPQENTLASLDHNTMDESQLQKDADRWMNGWKRQFSIEDFEAPLTAQNQKGREYRINLMRTIIDFCRERDYQPVWIIPPVTEYLAERFTPMFRQLYIYDYLKQVDRNLPLLDYSNEQSLMDKDLYFNSFFMNLRGRKLFTQRVLKDLKLI